MRRELPSLDLLGADLLVVPTWRRIVSLSTPFVLSVAFFLLARNRLWFGSVACAMVLTFVTYGSISHDLVHGTLRLPRRMAEALFARSS